MQTLSPRELDVLKLITSGMTNKQIAIKLNLSVLTIETYRKTLMRKVGCKILIELLAFALQHGYKLHNPNKTD